MTGTARLFHDFGTREARGRSALYEEFSAGAAGDPELLAAIGRLPRPKQQPNLRYAAVPPCSGTSTSPAAPASPI